MMDEWNEQQSQQSWNIFIILFRLAVVVFTVFFQGSTIKFLVNLLDIDR